MDSAPDRKLTTLLAADVAGYSRLMEADEAGTIARLKAFRAVILGEIAAHRGRLVNTAGDSVLAEFGSVVNAVDCAVRIQRDLAERNAGLPEAARMRFRIGVNLGDVMVDGDDLLGEGVNVAARLQQLAEPGGVLVSGPVYEQVRTKLALGFDYLGAQAVKNISEPVPAYRVVLGEAAEGRVGAPPRTVAAPAPAGFSAPTGASAGEAAGPTPGGRLKRRAAVAAVLIAALFAINMMTWHGYPWFVWPTLAILAGLALRTAWGWR